MNAKLLTFICLLIFLSANRASAYNYLQVSDPRNFKGSARGSLDSVHIVLRPKGLFMEVSLYMNITARSQNQFTDKDTLEAIYEFDLPENAAVTDSWLWLDNGVIIKGKILDVWTASRIYENIVKRRRDPSILVKNGQNQYQLRVFPLPAKAYRKIKLVYLVPMEFSGSAISRTLRFDNLNVNQVGFTEARLMCFPEKGFLAPVLSTAASSIPLFSSKDPDLGILYYKNIVEKDLFGGLKISYPLEKPVPFLYGMSEYKNEKYYQIGLKVDALFDQTNDKKLLVVMDLNPSNAASSATEIMNLMQGPILKKLGEKSKINFLYYDKLSLKFASDDWMYATQENIDRSITSMLKELGPLNITQAIMISALDYINRHGGDGRILLVSSDNIFNTAESCNNLIRALSEQGLPNIPVAIADLNANAARCNYIGNTYYCNSEYLFSNMAQISKGGHLIYRNTRDYNTMFSDCYNILFNSVYNYDLYSRSTDGFCYNRYGTGTSGSFLSTDYIVQTGKFTGEPPFHIEFSGFFNNRSYLYSFDIPVENRIFSDSALTRWWAGYHIGQLELSQGANVAGNVINVSTEYNVLSSYTAFLCLEDSTYFCPQCKDESGTKTAVSDTKKDSVEITVMPNPFTDHVRILVSNISNLKKSDIHLYSMDGREVAIDFTMDYGSSQDVIEWSPGEDVTPGIYLLSIRTERFSKIIRLMRNR